MKWHSGCPNADLTAEMSKHSGGLYESTVYQQIHFEVRNGPEGPPNLQTTPDIQTSMELLVQVSSTPR